MNVNDDISTIKGVGDKTAPLYRKIGLNSIDDVIHYFPRDYVFYGLLESDLNQNTNSVISFEATVAKKPLLKVVRRFKIITATLIEKCTGSVIYATWYNMPYLSKSLQAGQNYIFRGIPLRKNDYFQIKQPQIFTTKQYELIQNSLQPIYSLTKGLNNNSIVKSVNYCFNGLNLVDSKLYDMHFPKNIDCLLKAREDFVYKEFLLYILRLKLYEQNKPNTQNDFNIIPVAQTRRVIESLPYKLTNAQKRVFYQIEEDLCKNTSMSRLVQGDVGSGKTIIAFLACIMTGINGYQSAIMAPTEILATQHFEALCKLLKQNNISLNVALLTGSLSASAKKDLYSKLKNKEIDIVIGTHALIQEKVQYNNLALVVTDEQHRFGVHQREMLANKNEKSNAHILVMSATPIPRTLSIILFGDLDISIIDEVPARRLPIKNCVVNQNYRNTAYNFMIKEINSGHQIYIICPLIEPSESLEVSDVESYSDMLRTIMPENITIGCLHGKQRASDKQKIMNSFANGDIDILVSTTVIEVGVNVPNATVMMVEDADRFGLAQLHQLRGRVGRGESQSYCIFISGNSNPKTIERLEILNNSNDGFYIANEDLKLRGSGDLLGIRQSGEMDFDLGDIYNDNEILQKAFDDAKLILDEDPDLSLEKNKELKLELYKIMADSISTSI